MGVTKRPVFVKPADMPDLPQDGIDDRQHRSHQLGARQIFAEKSSLRARIAQLSRELARGRAARRSRNEIFVHADHHYHTAAFVVTIGEWHDDRPLGTHPAPAWP